MSRAAEYKRQADAILARALLRQNQSLRSHPLARLSPGPDENTPPVLSPRSAAAVAAATANADSLAGLRLKLHTLCAQLKVASATGALRAPPSPIGQELHRSASGRSLHNDLHALVDTALAHLDGVLALRMMRSPTPPPPPPPPVVFDASAQTDHCRVAHAAAQTSAAVAPEDELALSQAALETLQASASENERYVTRLSEVVAELEAQLESLETSEAQLRGQVASAEARAERAEHNCAALQTQVASSSRSDSMAQEQMAGLRRTYEQRVGVLEKTCNEQSARILELESHLTTALNNIDQLSVELCEHKEVLVKFRTDRNALRAALRDARIQLRDYEEAPAHDPERMAKLEARIISLRDKHRLTKDKLRSLIDENKALCKDNPERAEVFRAMRDLILVYQSTLGSASFACHACSRVRGMIAWDNFPKAAQDFEAAVVAEQCDFCQSPLFVPDSAS
ncbi:uncharacterized protein AMSG_06190 [Thecamonas trahens ATCC 50062]|uniref:Uncharacterized protein n=1 Tax=Thecamonas trahens ATCC 50062 TaxID=461836 RepID=A0A0L0DEZ9_THETB|nr:hypothetical protein AMSG_06190 [Thecamonas trahens ATCC 50062]KNC49893.1 hypothetical protein AMSG_06190 [Thecamonas trahens ATCC 50062]|eukprot:XP_013757375.1 hypothetical protein AMSG_06190 [Thecamonas trahens ATCC 50062]